MMKNASRVNSTFNIFSFIPFSVAVFGILSIGFFVAPTLFRFINPRPLASEVMTEIFIRFYPFAFVCTAITLVIELIRYFVLKKQLVLSKIWLLQVLMIVAVTFLMAYSNFEILPRIVDMRIHQNGPTLWTNPEFVSLHKRAEMLGKAIFALGLIPLGLMMMGKEIKS